MPAHPGRRGLRSLRGVRSCLLAIYHLGIAGARWPPRGQDETAPGHEAGAEIRHRVNLDRVLTASDAQAVHRHFDPLVHPGHRLLAGEPEDPRGTRYLCRHGPVQQDQVAVAQRGNDAEGRDGPGLAICDDGRQPSGNERPRRRRPGGCALDGREQLFGPLAMLGYFGHEYERIAEASHQPIAHLDTHMSLCVSQKRPLSKGDLTAAPGAARGLGLVVLFHELNKRLWTHRQCPGTGPRGRTPCQARVVTAGRASRGRL